MKTNLTIEQLKKCCELIDNGYDYAPGIGLIYDGNDNIIDPLYHNFLQLVIEAINKKNIATVTNWVASISVVSDDIKYKEFYFEDSSITEAKEQAIIYCLNNMED